MISATTGNFLWAAISLALLSASAQAQSAQPIGVSKARVVEYWTPERRADAIPRDLVIDPRGLGYLRHPDGSLQPYGHEIAAQGGPGAWTPSPFGKAGGGPRDTRPPAITAMNPAAGATIPASYTFSAAVKDQQSGVKTVTFTIQQGNASATYSASDSGGNTWSAPVSGLIGGSATWSVRAMDNAGNSRTSGEVAFRVGGSGEGTVSSAPWPPSGDGGTVQTAAGRLYFEMPANARRTKWRGYVCSGTVATDGTRGRSIILTAAHCVYDDAHKAFARNVMFIPDQADTSGSGTDRDCGNDPLGCWVPSFGVVDANWTTRTFPDNIEWDYAFYVVPDSGAHEGAAASSPALDVAASSLPVSFRAVSVDDGIPGAASPDFTHALGYSYSEDPRLMYCAEDMTTEGAVNWWLPSCTLSGGSSGGPWMQPMNESSGTGDVISVNSWGYTNTPGMAGPKLVGTSAARVFCEARRAGFPSADPLDGDAGLAIDASVGECR